MTPPERPQPALRDWVSTEQDESQLIKTLRIEAIAQQQLEDQDTSEDED